MKDLYKYERLKIKEYLGDVVYSRCKNYNAVLAGGAILSIFSNTEVNDFDFYFHTKEDAGNLYFDFEGCGVFSYTEKSILLSHEDKKINIITFDFFDSVQEIFNSFDFTVAMGAFDFKTETFIFDERFHRDIIGRKLFYSTTNQYPIGTLLRVQKYKDKGFKISSREMIKISLKVSQLNINSIEEAEKHLQGMYGIKLKEIWEEQNLGEFSIEKLLTLIEEYFHIFEEKKEYLTTVDFPDVEDIISGKRNKDDVNEQIFLQFFDKLYCFKTKGEYILSSHKSRYVPVSYSLSSSELEDIGIKAESVPEIKKAIVYKYVKRTKDGKLMSFFDENYEYKVGTFAEPANKNNYSAGIYTSLIGSRPDKYGDQDCAVILKLEVDLHDSVGHNTWNKVFVKEVIEKLEDIDLSEVYFGIDWKNSMNSNDWVYEIKKEKL